MDVWFDSGVVHHCVSQYGRRSSRPAICIWKLGSASRLVPQSLLTSVAMHGRAPYRGVLTTASPWTRGPQDVEIDRNTLVPQKLTSTLGADLVRLWVARRLTTQRDERVG